MVEWCSQPQLMLGVLMLQLAKQRTTGMDYVMLCCIWWCGPSVDTDVYLQLISVAGPP